MDNPVAANGSHFNTIRLMKKTPKRRNAPSVFGVGMNFLFRGHHSEPFTGR